VLLDTSTPAGASAARRLRSAVWFLWDGESFLLARYRGLLDETGWSPGRLARDYSTAIRVRPSRVRTG
jgi:hypothetical protein